MDENCRLAQSLAPTLFTSLLFLELLQQLCLICLGLISELDLKINVE